MAKKQEASPAKSVPHSPVPAPRSRRGELLSALLKNTTDPVHVRVLEAYRATGTVEGAEQEFTKTIEEIINET
jgi:hypothetical protein